MASFEEHCQDCERLLGDRHEKVNMWMDAMFNRFGPLHRFVRHHTRGVREARGLFGFEGGQAATIHILKDCGYIPTPRDWDERAVDSLGIRLDGPFHGHWDPQRFDAEAKKYLARYELYNS